MDTTRRQFLTLSGVALAPGALAGQKMVDGGGSPGREAAVAARLPRQALKADVVVAGGGLAGVCAALAAARNGASVVLIQDRSRLGGNSSSEIRMHVCGANHGKGTALWRESGLIEELKLAESATNPQRSFEMWDLLLYDKIISEPGIELLLDTAVVGARVTRGKVRSVTAICPGSDEQFEITGSFFIDCSGDAVLADAAGADLMRGREARDTYGESLAPEKADLRTMGNTLMFMAREHPNPMPFRAPAWARPFTAQDFERRPIRSWEYGYWWLEWGGDLDTIADGRAIRRELLRIVMGVWDHIKNSGQHPESANWALDWVGMIPGKRESRRVRGDHVLTQQELERGELFPDRVAYGGWPMDDHPPGGIDSKGEHPARQIPFSQPYSIPLRSLYSANRANLFMAGRNLSASHVAFSSTRVMATCAALGQAAGTAAAMCARDGLLPREIVAREEALRALQQQLLRDDQSLLDIRNDDPADLARSARVSCSAETVDGPASSVIDGVNRDVGDGASHQWRAAMPSPWLCLSWSAPQSIREVRVTFDSGLHRRLFLTGQDNEYRAQTRGPQPETVADYVLEGRSGGEWIALAQQEGNFRRLVVHRFEPIRVDAIRITVQRTNGDILARVFEIRCY